MPYPHLVCLRHLVAVRDISEGPDADILIFLDEGKYQLR